MFNFEVHITKRRIEHLLDVSHKLALALADSMVEWQTNHMPIDDYSRQEVMVIAIRAFKINMDVIAEELEEVL